ncbi:MAG: acetolactate synthase small subunit [Gammaproteobacteria bacterium]|nr:acetolactate synthase small subunit [Gammaproteobacteria bacterium]
MQHIISLLMENESGALSRVAGLFSARGYNIESLTVAPTEDETLSRMTIVTSGSEEIIVQINKQLNKLIDVVKLMDITANGEHIERELMLIKVKADTSEKREEVKRQADIFHGQILDVTDTTYVIELTGESSKLDGFIKAMKAADILETVRSGATGITRGETCLRL